MTTRQLLDLLELEFPSISGRQALIYVSNALADYVTRTRIMPKIVLTKTTDGNGSYELESMDASTNFASYMITVDRAYLGGNELPPENAERTLEQWYYTTDGVMFNILKKSGNNVIPYDVIGTPLEIVANTFPKPIEKDTDKLSIPDPLHMGILYGAKKFACEATKDMALYQVNVGQYEYYVREGIQYRNERGRSGTYHIKHHDY